MRGAERKPRRRCSGKKGKFRHRVCASKRKIKGLRGTERKPRRRCSEGKGKSRLRVCASKRRIKGLRGVKRKPRRRCSGKKENPGYGFAHQNGGQRVCGEPSANRAGRKCSVEIINKKSRRLSLVNGGRRRRHIRIIQFYGAPETCGRGECFFYGMLSDDLFEAAGYQICQDHFHRVARKERNDARHQRGLDVASGLENKPCTS